MEGAPNNAREQWEREQAARAAFGWFEPTAKAADEQRAARPPATMGEARRLSGDIAIDTDGGLVPRYEFAGQRAEQLVSGYLMLEPRLGPVRITSVASVGESQSELCSLIQLRWILRVRQGGVRPAR